MDRKKYIGGSDAAAIMGLNKYRTPISVWLEKLGMSESSADNQFTYWGKQLEDLVCHEFVKKSGIKVRRHNRFIHHNKYSFLGGNIDRAIVGENAFLEAKTCNQYKASDWDDSVPMEYTIQCHHYMLVGGFDYCYIAVLIGGNDFRYFKINRDKNIIDKLLEKELFFWYNNVLKEECPEAMSGDLDYLKSVENNVDGAVYFDANDEELVHEFEELRIEQSEAKKEIDRLRAVLFQKMNGQYVAEGERFLVKKQITANGHVRFSINRKKN